MNKIRKLSTGTLVIASIDDTLFVGFTPNEPITVLDEGSCSRHIRRRNALTKLSDRLSAMAMDISRALSQIEDGEFEASQCLACGGRCRYPNVGLDPDGRHYFGG